MSQRQTSEPATIEERPPPRAATEVASSPPELVLDTDVVVSLQRTAGNRAVTRLLTEDEPVIRRPGSSVVPIGASQRPRRSAVQRQAASTVTPERVVKPPAAVQQAASLPGAGSALIDAAQGRLPPGATQALAPGGDLTTSGLDGGSLGTGDTAVVEAGGTGDGGADGGVDGAADGDAGAADGGAGAADAGGGTAGAADAGAGAADAGGGTSGAADAGGTGGAVDAGAGDGAGSADAGAGTADGGRTAADPVAVSNGAVASDGGTGALGGGQGSGGGGGGTPLGMADPRISPRYRELTAQVEQFGGGTGGGGPAAAPSPPSGGELVAQALVSGGAEGLTGAAQAILIDTLLNKSTRRIPYAQGLMGGIQLGMQIHERGFVGAAQAQVAFIDDVKRQWASNDPVDKIEAVLTALDGINNIIGTISTICYVLAGAAFLASFIFPPLIPFIPPLVEAGQLLGNVNTLVGLAISLLRAIVMGFRIWQLTCQAASPEEQARRAESLRRSTAALTQEVGTRMANRHWRQRQERNRAQREGAIPAESRGQRLAANILGVDVVGTTRAVGSSYQRMTGSAAIGWQTRNMAGGEYTRRMGDLAATTGGAPLLAAGTERRYAGYQDRRDAWRNQMMAEQVFQDAATNTTRARNQAETARGAAREAADEHATAAEVAARNPDPAALAAAADRSRASAETAQALHDVHVTGRQSVVEQHAAERARIAAMAQTDPEGGARARQEFEVRAARDLQQMDNIIAEAQMRSVAAQAQAARDQTTLDSRLAAQRTLDNDPRPAADAGARSAETALAGAQGDEATAGAALERNRELRQVDPFARPADIQAGWNTPSGVTPGGPGSGNFTSVGLTGENANVNWPGAPGIVNVPASGYGQQGTGGVTGTGTSWYMSVAGGGAARGVGDLVSGLFGPPPGAQGASAAAGGSPADQHAQIPSPPRNAEETANSAAISFAELVEEQQRLQMQREETHALRSGVAADAALLEAGQASVDALRADTEATQSGLGESRAAQAEGASQVSRTGQSAGGMQANASEQGSLVGGFLGWFMSLIGMVPSELLGNSSEGAGGGQRLEQATEGQREMAQAAPAEIEGQQRTLEQFGQRTEQGEADAGQAAQEVSAAQTQVDTARADASEGTQELEQTGATVEQRLERIESAKQQQQARHDAAIGIMMAWMQQAEGAMQGGAEEAPASSEPA